MDPEEIKKLIEAQGKAFDEFKKAHDAEVVELKKRGSVDVVVADKVGKLEKAMDDAIEAKNKLEAGLVAERKEREELEKRLNRPGATEKTAADVELKTFNLQLSARRAEMKMPEVVLDQAEYDKYKAAFGNYLRRNDRTLSAEEIKTLQVSVDPDGGYLVTPDVSGRIIKKVYETSPMRQLATVITITTDKLEGIEDRGEAGAGYAGERATSGDTTTPQIGKYSIPVWAIDTEPKATQQLLDDAGIDIEAWLADKVADKFSRFENAEHITGTAKIRGVMGYGTIADSGSGVTWGSVGFIKTGVNGDFASSNPADKIFDLVGLLKNAYLNGAAFLTRREVITKIRKFKDTTGQYLWQPALVAGQPETLMGYPVTRAEDIAALSTNGLSMAFGNFKEAFTIVDRQGNRVLRDPYTAKPYVKFYTSRRSGAGVVDFDAYKLLQFST